MSNIGMSHVRSQMHLSNNQITHDEVTNWSFCFRFRSFNPQAGQLRELDAIAAVIIGGGSIFGGYGTVLGSLAGAAVIALMRALLSLQIITSEGNSFVMPQHWINVFIGIILITAVLGDIWMRRIDWRTLFGIFGGRRVKANA